MTESNETSPLEKLGAAPPDPGAAYAVRNADWRREADAHNRSHPANSRMEQTALQVFGKHRTTEAALETARAKRDRRAFDASAEYARAELEKEAAVTRERDDFVVERVNEFIEAGQVLANDSIGSPTADERRQPRDATHQAAISHACAMFDTVLPEMAIGMLDAAQGDPALGSQLLLKGKTQLRLVVDGKRTIFQHLVPELSAAIDRLEMAIETPFTIRRRVTQEIIDAKREGLRQFLNLLETYSTRDPVFNQLAKVALRDFDDTDWLDGKE